MIQCSFKRPLVHLTTSVLYLGTGFIEPWDTPLQAASEETNHPVLPSQPLEVAPLVAPPVVNEAPVDNVAEHNERVQVSMGPGPYAVWARSPHTLP